MQAAMHADVLTTTPRRSEVDAAPDPDAFARPLEPCCGAGRFLVGN